MNQTIGYVTILVRDYDEAIAFYRDKLEFRLVEKTNLNEEKRWILMAPDDSRGTCFLLAKTSTPEQHNHIGNQAGGRVFLFLHTDNFWRDYKKMKKRGVNFLDDPRDETYGTVVVFTDLYGNKWDLLELKKTINNDKNA